MAQSQTQNELEHLFYFAQFHLGCAHLWGGGAEGCRLSPLFREQASKVPSKQAIVDRAKQLAGPSNRTPMYMFLVLSKKATEHSTF